MGKACSKNSAVVANIASSRRESTTTPATTTQNGPSQKPTAKGAVESEESSEAVRIVTTEQRALPVELVADASAREEGGSQKAAPTPPGTGGEKLSITTVESGEGAAPVAIIHKEKVVVEEGEKGEGVMKVSVADAIITADLPGLPTKLEGVSPEDLELLRKAHEQVKQQREQATGPVVVDVTDEKTRPTDSAASSSEGNDAQKGPPSRVGENEPKAEAYGYLLYSSKKDGGSLFLLWSKEQLDRDSQAGVDDEVILLSFVPGFRKTIPKIKFSAQRGRTQLIKEIETKWEVWSKAERRKYFEAWAHVFKVCDEYEAMVTLREWPTAWPPGVNVNILRSGPTGTISVTLRPGRPTKLDTFSYLAVLPTGAETFFKEGSSPTEKKFVDAASAAGGAFLRLIRRGCGAALDQDVLLEWLKEDGIEISPEQKGITLGGDNAEYERRSADAQHR